MKNLLTLLSANHLEDATSRALLGNSTPKDLELLGEVATKTHIEIEGRLMQLESIARALQVASVDEGNTGIFDRTDGFNVSHWLEVEAQTLQELYSMQGECKSLLNRALEAKK